MSIAEVAKAAGVSTATVSRVLNDLPGVRTETIQQVRAAVEALNYKPQRARRARSTTGPSSRGTRTGNIAVITLGQTRDWLQLPVMASVVAGIQHAAAEFGLRLILDDLPDPLRPSQLVQGRQIDGAVVFLTGSMPVTSYEAVLAGFRQRIPIVWAMGMEMTAAGVDHVTPDNISTGYLAHSYLRSQGCERVGYLTTNPAWVFMRLRGQAFLNAAYDAKQVATAYIVTDDRLLADSYGKHVVAAPTLEQLVALMAKEKSRPTGLFVANDATTAQVYPLLDKHGLEVGRDLTVVSCDNEEVRLSALQPRPASIDPGAEQIGFRAVVRLRARMQRPNDPPLVIQVSPKLALPPS
jgi:LacI family transcriptional regulator